MAKRSALWNKIHKDNKHDQFKCECKFETNDGNLMAFHLLDCDKKAKFLGKFSSNSIKHFFLKIYLSKRR